MVNEDRNVCAGPRKMGLSPWNVEVVEQPALMFVKTRKYSSPAQDGCGLWAGCPPGMATKPVWEARGGVGGGLDLETY